MTPRDRAAALLARLVELDLRFAEASARNLRGDLDGDAMDALTEEIGSAFDDGLAEARRQRAAFLAAHEGAARLALERWYEQLEVPNPDGDILIIHARDRALEDAALALDVPRAAALRAAREPDRLETAEACARAHAERPVRDREQFARAIGAVDRAGNDRGVLQLVAELLRSLARGGAEGDEREAISDAVAAIEQVVWRGTPLSDARMELARALRRYDEALARRPSA